MNALAKEPVGIYVNAHCVAAVQKVATFRKTGAAKEGGNVAAYFCTPERQVLHAIAGPVDEAAFLRETRWVVETWNLAQLEDLKSIAQLQNFFRKAHFARFTQEHRGRLHPGDAQCSLPVLLARHAELNNAGKVHLLLSTTALPRIETVYRPVFEHILNEKISTNPVQVVGK